jgi:hypothetical protein
VISRIWAIVSSSEWLVKKTIGMSRREDDLPSGVGAAHAGTEIDIHENEVYRFICDRRDRVFS